MNILAVAAHPDDAELGCLGTLLEKKRQGHSVYVVALAPGGYGKHTWEEIRLVYEKVRQLLRQGKGKGEYLLGSFPIGSIQHNWETVGYVDNLVKRFNVDTIITHHYGESHQDHIIVQRIGLSAARRKIKRLWLWESSIYTHRNVLPFRPQLYVPLSRESYAGKMTALKRYEDAGLLESREVEAQGELARYRGGEIRTPHAEAFEVVWEVDGR